jgi:FkbM family methyltransferase
MLVLPELRGISEVYEPEVWPRIMSEVRGGDTIIDVGSHIGLYTVAFAKRVGPQGRIIAFEPDPENFEMLRRQISLNQLDVRVEACPMAVADCDGVTQFAVGRGVQSSIAADGNEGTSVKVCRLDSVFRESKVDLIKIDVEGFEEKVIEGAETLLSDLQRKPRAIFIEVHPYNWHLCGTTSDSLIDRLARNSYNIVDLKGERLFKIRSYGEIIALRHGG